jgi:hypothetical protein
MHMESVPIVPTVAHILNATTVYTIVTDEKNDNCAICQDPMTEGQQQRTINACQHKFHMGCLDRHFTNSVKCPNCRYDIRTSNP